MKNVFFGLLISGVCLSACGPKPEPVAPDAAPVPVVKVEPLVVTPEIDAGVAPAAPTAAVSQPVAGTVAPATLPAVEAPSAPASK